MLVGRSGHYFDVVFAFKSSKLSYTYIPYRLILGKP